MAAGSPRMPNMGAHLALYVGVHVVGLWTRKMGTPTFTPPCPEPWERPFLRIRAH